MRILDFIDARIVAAVHLTLPTTRFESAKAILGLKVIGRSLLSGYPPSS